MIKIYAVKQFVLASLILIAVNGCHQDPAIPASAIPPACRVVQVVTIDAPYRDTLTYRYNDFGHVISATYRRRMDGQLTTTTDQTFTYSADHYLNGQTERITTYTSNGPVQTNKGYLFTYQENPKLIQQIKVVDNTTGKLLSGSAYTYEGSNLKTYTELDGTGAPGRTFTYDASGKLTQVSVAGQSGSPTVTNGKISSEVVGSLTYTYTYDGQGQLKQQEARSTTSTTAPRSVVVYTYDTKPYWKNTQLRFRGIPTPDLGRPVQAANILTSTVQNYQGDKKLNEVVTRYTYAYNANGYPIGYSRTDGARQVINYSNCP